MEIARAMMRLVAPAARALLALAVLAQALLWSTHFTIGAARTGAQVSGALVICTARGPMLIETGDWPRPSPLDPASDNTCAICAAFAAGHSPAPACEVAGLSFDFAANTAGDGPPPLTFRIRPASIKNRGPPV